MTERRTRERDGFRRLRLLLTAHAPRDWMMRALCKDHDPDLWFPHPGTPSRKAVVICNQCPVAADCYHYAAVLVSSGAQLQGIWAGRDIRTLTRRQATVLVEQQQKETARRWRADYE